MTVKDNQMTPLDKFVNTPVAAGAVTSPWWLDTLAQLSHIAAQLVPIVGLTWLVVQIIYKSGCVFGWWNKKD